ncbi:TetR/AcrR family transcriptional regulator [Arthrobacter sp. Cr_A7]|uniref:TetR/AcrR family transcriptional regulator n=1 Tax=Arthrobacter sp. Cr_A7 TaxID=3031017 RepID=UPI0023DBAD95|nr:TetR/AcrR family transcriptional regulator [Arthrobacter sp. Cr_A7]MDF2049144.1 TetR/AcrR family transcriptional regulator [Arthrobacter sp. Cr_A7]
MLESEDNRSPRVRILEAAAVLLREGGREAVSTRSVSAAAGVQPQTIYRQYGDKARLLDAVVTEGFRVYIESKAAHPRTEDPVEDLRAGWDLHVAFGCENPALYVLMYGEPDAGRGLRSADQAADILRGLVGAVARAGRLRIDVEKAAAMIQAASVGVVLTILAQGPFGVSGLSEAVREAMIEAVATEPVNRAAANASAPAAEHAIALRATLGDVEKNLTPGETLLLEELLRKIAAQH